MIPALCFVYVAFQVTRKHTDDAWRGWVVGFTVGAALIAGLNKL